MAFVRIPAAATDAYLSEALRLHTRIDFADDDPLLNLMANTAASEIEAYCEIALLRQTISLIVEATTDPISLPIGPLSPEATVTINGAPVTGAITSGRYPVLTLPDAVTGAVLVTYEAGYGDEADALPADLLFAIIDHASRLYDVRGADEKQHQGLSTAARRICARYRRVGS